MRLLLVEDDQKLSERLRNDLQRAGYAVDVARNGIDAQHLGMEEPYDAVILDLGLPQRSGMDVLKHWRSQGRNLPVIVLTARDAWYERVDGFKAGADDYLGKPFHTEELLARVGAVIKRSRDTVGGTELAAAGIRLNEDTQTATTRGGEQVQLTATEFRLLRYFMLHPGRVLSKSRLTAHVYDFDSDKDSNVIEVYITRLRKKLGEDLITTRRGQGYIFGPPPA